MSTIPNFSQSAIFSEISTPTEPDSGYLKVYAKSGALCSIANGASEQAYLTSTSASTSFLALSGGTLTGDLKFTDSLYDIGKSGATRPRDGFFSRGLGVGDGVNGVYFWAAGTNTRDMYISNAINGSEPQCVIHRVDGISIGSANGAGAVNFYNDSAVVGTLWGTIRFDSANVFSQRNSTNAQIFRLTETYTSSTSFGAFQIKANSGTAYQIGSAIGSAGGTNREIQIGHWNSAGTFGAALNVATVGGVTIQPLTATGSSLTVELGNNYDYTSPAFKMNRLGNTIGTIYMDGFWNFVIDTSRSASGYFSSVSGGVSGVANRYGMRAYSAGAFAADGDAQAVYFVLRRKTTDATPTTLMLDGSSTRLTITSGKVLFCDVSVSGIKSDGSASACFKRKLAIKNVSGTTSLVGAVEIIGSDIKDNPLSDIAITADDVNDALQINVTGINTETWRWVAAIEGIEVAYGT